MHRIRPHAMGQKNFQHSATFWLFCIIAVDKVIIMKKIITTLLCIAALSGYSQSNADVLSAAQKLIDEKKYESA